jgi:hypothetical protein
MRGAGGLALALAALAWLTGCAAGSEEGQAQDRPFNHVFDCTNANSGEDPRCGPFLRD